MGTHLHTVIKKPPTLRDVAELAGCATSVVSTVVNKAKGNVVVGDKTRARVLKAAKELGYRCNFASRCLVQRKTRTFGVYIPHVPWAGLGFIYDDMMLRGIEDGCLAHNYDLLITNMAGKQGPEICKNYLDEGRIDGLILMHLNRGGEWVQNLIDGGYPIVAVDYSKPEPNIDAVIFDNDAVSRIAVKHLQDLGHRRIGFIGTVLKNGDLDTELRQKAYIAAMTESGTPPPDDWIIDHRVLDKPIKESDPAGDITKDEAVKRICAGGKNSPTAWVAQGDFVAQFTIAGLQRMGINVPGDVSIIGVDDSDVCRQVYPTLSSIRHPLVEMGKRAVGLLMDRSRHIAKSPDGKPHGRHIYFDPELVARESTGPCPV